jgi:5-methylcytosine-specific restriction endonuclease McrA
MLCSIPDRELIARLEELRRAERETSVDILHHLNEIERRSLHLRLGYPSLFAYCTGHLRYSESAAARRVHAARCLRRFPRVGPLLQSGEINLMTLGLVANILTEATLDQWLDRIRGKTQREVEAIAATVRAPITLRDRARLVHVAVPTVAPLPLTPTSPASAEAPKSSMPMFTSSPHASSQPATPPEPGAFVNSSTNSQTGGKQSSTPVATQPKVYIQFLADQSFMAKYRIAASILSNKLTKLTFESVFVALIEEFIRRHEPAERHLRRERADTRPRFAADRIPVPLRTRDAVFTRDRGRCTYVGSDGKRCNETIRLHVDHIKPVARGGTNDISNLRLLCARHNQLQAEKILGRDVMSGFRKREGVATVQDAR